MTALVVIIGILVGGVLPTLIGLLGRRRKIGFGWAFFLSVVFTPIVGLVVTLLSHELPYGEKRWGCLGIVLGIIGLALAGVLLAGVLAAVV